MFMLDECTRSETYFIWAVILAIVFLVLWWVFTSVNALQPSREIPDEDPRPMLKEFDSFPEELWFRNNKCIFERYIPCNTQFRYIVYESNGVPVYDSQPQPYGSPESAVQLVMSKEYLTASITEVASTVRGNLWNIAILVKRGDRYRIVHISQRRYTDLDPEY